MTVYLLWLISGTAGLFRQILRFQIADDIRYKLGYFIVDRYNNADGVKSMWSNLK